MATNEIKLGINLRQNKNTKNSGYGKYYPEVDVQETLSLKGFAKHMSDHAEADCDGHRRAEGRGRQCTVRLGKHTGW